MIFYRSEFLVCICMYWILQGGDIVDTKWDILYHLFPSYISICCSFTSAWGVFNMVFLMACLLKYHLGNQYVTWVHQKGLHFHHRLIPD